MDNKDYVNEVLGEDNVTVIKTAIQRNEIDFDDLRIFAREMGGSVSRTFARNKREGKVGDLLFMHMLDTWYNEELRMGQVDGFKMMKDILEHPDIIARCGAISNLLKPLKVAINDIGLKKNHHKIRELFEKNNPGQPADVSDQGADPVKVVAVAMVIDPLTCSSHAVGKAIVDILDWAGWDTKQEDIIDYLRDNYQEDYQPEFPDKLFDNKIIEVELSNKNDASKKIKAEFKIKISKQDGKETVPYSHDYIHSEIPEDLKEHQIGMVIDWDFYNVGLRKYTPHAVYAEKYNASAGEFSCINSWGPDILAKPKVCKADVRAIYYVTIEQQNLLFK